MYISNLTKIVKRIADMFMMLQILVRFFCQIVGCNNLSLKITQLVDKDSVEFDKRLHDILVKFEMLIEYEQANDRVLRFNQIQDNEKYAAQSA